MKQTFEVEFYYLSNNPDHCQTLSLIEEALRAVTVNGVIQFRIIDVESSDAIMPENLPGIPCLRRVLPAPERFILASTVTPEQVHTVLGLPRTLIAEDQDRLSSWTGLRS